MGGWVGGRGEGGRQSAAVVCSRAGQSKSMEGTSSAAEVCKVVIWHCDVGQGRICNRAILGRGGKLYGQDRR